MKKHPSFLGTMALGAVLFTGSAQAQIEPGARALAKAASDTIGAAKTIRLTAKHTIDPALGVGSKLEKGPLRITVKRPNQFHVLQ